MKFTMTIMYCFSNLFTITDTIAVPTHVKILVNFTCLPDSMLLNLKTPTFTKFLSSVYLPA